MSPKRHDDVQSLVGKQALLVCHEWVCHIVPVFNAMKKKYRVKETFELFRMGMNDELQLARFQEQIFSAERIVSKSPHYRIDGRGPKRCQTEETEAN